jgi:hypothetical protein
MAESASAASRPKKGIWQWFWRGSELALARAERRNVPQARRALLTRAETAKELGDRAFDPIDPLRHGPSLPLAVSLYREAAHWALCAQSADPELGDTQSALASVDPALLTTLAGGDEGLEQVRAALVTKTFRETAEDRVEVQRADARALRDLTQALIAAQLGPEQRVGRLLVQRWLRSGFTLLALSLLLLLAPTLVRLATQGPDLAQGKPLRPSSVTAGWAAHSNDYLFHTLEEDSPWVEIDLQKPTQFSVVEVINRRDCCQERALPTVVEVSSDRTRWKEVSRRTESYSTWRAKFAPATARYVRVRVARHSYLHLAGIAVRAY